MATPEPVPTSVLDACRRVLAYLRRHPHARDTFQGLTEWWIWEQWAEEEEAKLRRATELLVERGFLLTSERSDGRVHYRLNDLMLNEIDRFLAERTPDGAPLES